MDTHLIIFILSLAGIVEALYLNYECRRNHAPVCIIGNQCEIVWESKYSKTFGVSNEILGLIFYTTLAFVEGMIFLGDTSASVALGEIVLLAGGSIMSVYFFYIQWRIIKAWCFWCTVSAIIVWVMTLLRIAL